VRRREVLAVAFVLAGALLVWPLLSIANRPVLVLGVPALVAYLFGIWAAIVAVLAWSALRSGGEDTA
jgi:hypothetical protein